jgi:hypothetical protein
MPGYILLLAYRSRFARPFRMQPIDYKGMGMAMTEMVRSFSPMRIILGKTAMPMLKHLRIKSRPHKDRSSKGSARDAGEDYKCCQ